MNFGRFDQGAGRVGDPINTAMFMVTVGITGVVLHVTNEGILPIHHIEGTIGSKLEISWAEI